MYVCKGWGGGGKLIFTYVCMQGVGGGGKLISPMYVCRGGGGGGQVDIHSLEFLM